MDSLEIKFNKTKLSHCNWSQYLCFVETVKGKNLTHKEIYDSFKKFVEKKEYNKVDENDIIEHLYKISNK